MNDDNKPAENVLHLQKYCFFKRYIYGNLLLDRGGEAEFIP